MNKVIKYKVKNINPLQVMLKKFSSSFPEELIIEINSNYVNVKTHEKRNLIKGYRFPTSDMFEAPTSIETPFEITLPSLTYTINIISKYKDECIFMVEVDEHSTIQYWGLSSRKNKDIFPLLEDVLANKVRIPNSSFDVVMDVTSSDICVELDKDDISNMKKNYQANTKVGDFEYIVTFNNNKLCFDVNNCQTILENSLTSNYTNVKISFSGAYLQTLESTTYKVYPMFDGDKIIFEDVNSDTKVCFACFATT